MPLNQITRWMIESQKTSISVLWGNKRLCSRMMRRGSRKFAETLRSGFAIFVSWLTILLKMRRVTLTVTSAAPKKITAHKSMIRIHAWPDARPNYSHRGLFVTKINLASGPPIVSSSSRTNPNPAIPRDKPLQTLLQSHCRPIVKQAASLGNVCPSERYIPRL